MEALERKMDSLSTMLETASAPDPAIDAVKRVKKLIIEKSLTVSELSKRTGYSISYVSMVINGRRKNHDVRDAIARALERSSQELWAGC